MKVKVSNVCQLIDKTKLSASKTILGVTFTNNGDGSYTINGKSTNTSTTFFNFCNLGKSLRGTVFSNSITNGYYAQNCTYDNNNGQVFFTIWAGSTYDNVVIIPQLFDLTEMFSTGNMPTTIKDFRKAFPDKYYEYSPKCFETIHKLHYVDSTGHAYTIYRGKFVTETNNLLHIKDYEGTINGVTITIKNDLITLNGTSTGVGAVYPTITKITNSNTCMLSVKELSGSIQQTNWLQRYYIVIYSKSLIYPDKNITGITPDSNTTSFQLSFEKGTYFINYTFKIQIEEGSTETDYKPHKHIAFN